MESINDGIYAATLTPLNNDLSINYEELVFQSNDLIQRGCEGVVLFGTTGEGPSFSIKERLDALSYLIKQGMNPKKVILANGGNNVPDTIHLILEGLKNGIKTFLICPPTFYKNVTQEGVRNYYREIIKKVDLDDWQILLYHIPQYSGVPISLETIQILRAEFPHHVIGLKGSEGNLPFTKSILKECPNFKVFVGNESQIAEAVGLGGAGSICGISNLYPEMICDLYQQGKKGISKNPDEFTKIFNEIKNHPPFIPYAKMFMAKKRSSQWKLVRPPLLPNETDNTQN